MSQQRYAPEFKDEAVDQVTVYLTGMAAQHLCVGIRVLDHRREHR